MNYHDIFNYHVNQMITTLHGHLTLHWSVCQYCAKCRLSMTVHVYPKTS